MNKFIDIFLKVRKAVTFVGLSIQIILAFLLILTDLPAGFMLAIIFLVFDLMLWVYFGRPTIYKNIIVGSTIMIVFLTGCIYAILFRIINFVEIPRAYNVGSVSDWISYSGSIIGGSMTMFALVFTIQHNEKQYKNDFKSKIMPYIEAVKNDGYGSGTSKFPIKIVNRSDYPLSDLTIFCAGGHYNGEYTELTAKVKTRVDFLPKNGECIVEISDYSIDLRKMQIEDEFELSIGCKFFDYLHENEYYHDFDFCLVPRYSNNQFVTPVSFEVDSVHNTFYPDYEKHKKKLQINFKKKK